jgi:monothiol glutaredoxin
MQRSILILAASLLTPTTAFAPSPTQIQRRTPLSLSLDDTTQSRIQTLVDENPVLLFMKGTKLFPQCGFSNTACQILQSYNIDFETVDVLADENIRQGVKVFSDWPTIPQLYVCGEFVGGSDIMIEMYQSGELGEMIEKVSYVLYGLFEICFTLCLCSRDVFILDLGQG